MSTTRRRLLTYGLGGVGLLAIPAIGLSLRSSVLVPSPQPLVTFNERRYSTLAALADALCPGDDRLPSASELDVAGVLDRLFARMHPGVGVDLGAALDLLENALAGAILDRRFECFTACSLERRQEVLIAWRTSSISVRRAVYKALRGFVMAAYWGNPATWAELGYGGMPDYSAVPSPVPIAEFLAARDAARAPVATRDDADPATPTHEAHP